MKLHKSLICTLAALPLIACGAAPESEPTDGTLVEEMTGTQALGPALRTIDFDTDGFGTALTEGQDISAATGMYALRGVKFSCVGCGGSKVFARAPGKSGRGVSVRPVDVSTTIPQPEFDASFGVIRATLLKPASVVEIDAFGMINQLTSVEISLGDPWLKAYDASGNEVGEADYAGSLRQWRTLSVISSSYDIAFVEFSSSTASSAPYGTLARFDNLRFDQPPLKPPPQIVPLAPSGPSLPPPLP